jgi:ABC-type uncharacterized transport system auxiliary subunit
MELPRTRTRTRTTEGRGAPSFSFSASVASGSRSRIGLAAFCLLLLSSASCLLPGVPDTAYYTLHYDVPTAAKNGAPPRFPIRVAVEEFRIASEYRTDRIVYRESPYELGYYNYYRWAASPEVLVRRKVREHLAASNLCAAVEDATLVRPDLYLEGRIERIEEIDADERWTAHLVLELALREPGEKLPLLTRRYDLTREAASRKPLDVVKAMSALLAEASRAFVAEAEKALARRKGS